jgi:N-acetylmuramoyl-L-alanine amidase
MWTCSWAAHAALVSFSVRIQDDLRVADVELMDKQGAAYVSLPSLISQIGGGWDIAPERVQVDLDAKTAWLKLNTTQVNASLGDFFLNRPVIEQGNDALIALEDVPVLFEKAFRLTIKQDVPVTVPPQPPPQTAAPSTQGAAVPPSTEAPLPATLPEPSPPAASEPRRPVDRPVDIVIVDPGHGGKDTGCEGPGGLKEGALALAVAQRVCAALEKNSRLKAVLTRDNDRDLTRKERIAFADAQNGDLLISVHAGASFAQGAHGFETFCCAGESAGGARSGRDSRRGAAYAQRSRGFAEAVAGALQETTGAENRGVHEAPCAILLDVSMSGIVVEMGFLTNPTDEALLQTEAYQEKIAAGIAAGVNKHLENGTTGGTPR